MPEIPPSLPSPVEPAGPGFSLPVGALPGALRPGESLVARVLAQVSAGRYALAIGGREVLADSAAALSPGDQLRLVVRQTGTRVLMDLVPLGQAADAGDAGPVRAGGAPSVQGELQGALSRGAGLGELLAEATRALASAEAAAGAVPSTESLRGLAGQMGEALSALASGQAGEAAGPGLAAAVAALPDQVARLLAAVEARLAEVLRSLPEIAALGALAELLESLPAAAAGTGASAQGAALSGETDPRLAGLLDRLVATLQSSGASAARSAQLPAELRQALGALTSPELSALQGMVAERERAALAASPQVASLTGAHRALAAAQERLDAAQLLSLANSSPAQSFSYLELPVPGGPEAGTAGLRVLVKRDAGEGGAGGQGRGRGTVRAVLDLSLSALGPVWSELALTGRNLAVRLELADRERSDFVAAGLDELRERLAAHGLEVSAAAAVAKPRRSRAVEAAGPEAEETGGLDLWA